MSIKHSIYTLDQPTLLLSLWKLPYQERFYIMKHLFMHTVEMLISFNVVSKQKHHLDF